MKTSLRRMNALRHKRSRGTEYALLSASSCLEMMQKVELLLGVHYWHTATVRGQTITPLLLYFTLPYLKVLSVCRQALSCLNASSLVEKVGKYLTLP